MACDISDVETIIYFVGEIVCDFDDASTIASNDTEITTLDEDYDLLVEPYEVNLSQTFDITGEFICDELSQNETVYM